jgi:uncharacterized protein YtpQ (UPF0354 family)
MFPTTQKTFVHPGKVYRLEYPAHWDQVTQKDGESCGFGPHERDDVGLWISIMPMSIDTDKLKDDLPKLLEMALDKFEGDNLRQDKSLRNHGVVADMKKEGEGGHYWLVSGGDVVLFASTQVPVAERDVWNPLFQKVMSSLLITRDEQLQVGRIAFELLGQLRERYPEQEFKLDNDKIRGQNQVVYLTNVVREVQAHPERQTEIIKHFAKKLNTPTMEELGFEDWDEVRGRIVPVLKPRDYIHKDGATQSVLWTEWLADVLICYVIQSKNMYRFVTGWDVNRWEQTNEKLHEEAVKNLAKMPWPRELMGAGYKDNGRIIIVDTEDNLASSRLLHPDLHKMFSGPLGSPFWAGIPSRNTLVLFSNRKELKTRIGRRLKKDYSSTSYPITDLPFLVTRDGVAPSKK